MHVYKIIGSNTLTYDVGYYVPNTNSWVCLDSVGREDIAQELVSFLNGGPRPTWFVDRT